MSPLCRPPRRSCASAEPNPVWPPGTPEATPFCHYPLLSWGLCQGVCLGLVAHQEVSNAGDRA
jgi:hypothetical protein